MKLDEVILIIKHPELGKERQRYAYRYKWFRDAHDEWRAAAEEATEPTVVRVDITYLEYNTKTKLLMLVDRDTGKKFATLESLSNEDMAADDWCFQRTPPRVVGMGRRDLATLDYMLTLPRLKKQDKQLIEQLIEELKIQRAVGNT